MVLKIKMFKEIKSRSKIDAELFIMAHFYILSIEEYDFYMNWNERR